MSYGGAIYPKCDELFGVDLVGQPVLTMNIVGELKNKVMFFGERDVQIPSTFVHLGSVQFCYPVDINSSCVPCIELINVDFKFITSVDKKSLLVKLVEFSRKDSVGAMCDNINAIWVGYDNKTYSIFTSFVLSVDKFLFGVKDTCLRFLAKCKKNSENPVTACDLHYELILPEITLDSNYETFNKIIEQTFVE